MNPGLALASALTDELIRSGMREAVVAPGSRSAPLALALYSRAQAGDVRLHVRFDERSAGFLALGLAKASRLPVAVVCTSGTAAVHLHAAVIEADEAAVPLLVLTADRPPELRGTGANQTIDQVKLYGQAVRWFAEVGQPAAGQAAPAYWRSLACRAWALASGASGSTAGPVHLNVPLREPLIPENEPERPGEWPAWLRGRPGGRPWTRFGGGPDGTVGCARTATGSAGRGSAGGLATTATAGAGGARAGGAGPMAGSAIPGSAMAGSAVPGSAGSGGARASSPGPPALELPWTERGLVVCGDGDYATGPLLELAAAAAWPVLAEPSSNARRGPNALSGYPYLLACTAFAAAHRPDVIVSAGRPGLSRGQQSLLRAGPGVRHIVISQGPGRWADPGRSATDVAQAVRLSGGPAAAATGWLTAWRQADQAARAAADAILDAGDGLTEPRLARDLAAGLPDGSLLWAASSLPVRDLDQHLVVRDGLLILANRGASGIDGLVSSAIGGALAHQRAGGGPAAALLGDLALLHDAAGLMIGPAEPRPDLLIVVVNNDGGGIFSMLEQASLPGPFERIFGTPHGTGIDQLAAAAGLPCEQLRTAADLKDALAATRPGSGLRLAELRTSRPGQAGLRGTIAAAVTKALGGAPGTVGGDG